MIYRQKKSEIMEQVKDRNVKWEETRDNTLLELNKRDYIQIQGLNIKSDRTEKELDQYFDQAERFNEDLSKEKDEEKILSIINDEGIKKSSIFDF